MRNFIAYISMNLTLFHNITYDFVYFQLISDYNFLFLKRFSKLFLGRKQKKAPSHQETDFSNFIKKNFINCLLIDKICQPNVNFLNINYRKSNSVLFFS